MVKFIEHYNALFNTKFRKVATGVIFSPTRRLYIRTAKGLADIKDTKLKMEAVINHNKGAAVQWIEDGFNPKLKSYYLIYS